MLFTRIVVITGLPGFNVSSLIINTMIFIINGIIYITSLWFIRINYQCSLDKKREHACLCHRYIKLLDSRFDVIFDVPPLSP